MLFQCRVIVCYDGPTFKQNWVSVTCSRSRIQRVRLKYVCLKYHINQCFLNVRPPSQTVAQHWNNVGCPCLCIQPVRPADGHFHIDLYFNTSSKPLISPGRIAQRVPLNYTDPSDVSRTVWCPRTSASASAYGSIRDREWGCGDRNPRSANHDFNQC